MAKMDWDGEGYHDRIAKLAASGQDMHGEVNFVMGLEPVPASVLDAGCGTGRVAIELARRGVEVVPVDIDASMLATARRLAPDLGWLEADLASLDLGRLFDVVVMAGNVPLFTPAGTQPAVVAGCARHVRAGGALVCGFQISRDYGLNRDYGLDDYDADCASAGLDLTERYATWDRAPFTDGPYAVSVHRRS